MARKYKYRPLVKSDKRRNREDAIYQFVLDHSTPVPKGFHIQFYIRNKKDFFTRIQARQYGLERVINVDKEWIAVMEKDKEFRGLTKRIKKAKKVWWKRILLKLINL